MKTWKFTLEFIGGGILLLWGVIENNPVMTTIGAWAIILWKIDRNTQKTINQ